MNLAVLVADGFEEIEALTVVDYCRRAGIEVDLVSIMDDLEVTGAHNITIIADRNIKDIDYLKYKGLVIPGGLPGASNLRDDKRVIEMVKLLDGENRLVAAICAGPIVLERAGIIAKRNITSYPGFEEDLSGNYLEDNLVEDGNIITARGPALALVFALAIIKYYKGQEVKEEIEKDILYALLMDNR